MRLCRKCNKPMDDPTKKIHNSCAAELAQAEARIAPTPKPTHLGKGHGPRVDF